MLGALLFPLAIEVRARLCKLQKGCIRLAAASDKVYQLLAHGRWFSLASSTSKTGRYDKAEILLKVVLNTKIQIFLLNLGTVLTLWSFCFCYIYRHEGEITQIITYIHL